MMHMEPCNSSMTSSVDVQQRYSRQGRQRQCGELQQLTQQQAGSPVPCAVATPPRSSQSRPGSVLQQSCRQPTSCLAGGCPSRGGSRGSYRPGALPTAAPAAARPSSYVAAHGHPSTTPREHRAEVQQAYEGPRSYALALASAGAHRHSGHAAVDRGQHSSSSRPSSAAATGSVSRPGTAGYAEKARLPCSSSRNARGSSSSRGHHSSSSVPPQLQSHHLHKAQQWPQHKHSPYHRAAAAAADALAGASTAVGSSTMQSRPLCNSLSGCRRPGSAGLVHKGSSWPVPDEQQGNIRSGTVAAAAAPPLLLADCFRPSTAAGPASISGVVGQQCGSRPHTAAAAVARCWDAGSAGLSSILAGAGAESGQEDQAVSQEQLQLWCAVHEIDGRPATRNGVRSR
jgi:hypothetical protein